MNLVDEKNYDEVWIIGGSIIYKQFIYMFEYINKIFITHIDSSYNCDTFFPELPENYKLETSSITSEKYTLLNFQRYINLK
jgi:dihydrofolate reductase/thymidylate synthase